MRVNVSGLFSFLVVLMDLSRGNAVKNFTSEMAADCKAYFCKNGYDYVNFFKVKSMHRSPDIKFEMHLAVKGTSNAHILLSPSSTPTLSDSIYEIVIGAGGNKYSELRRMRKKFGKSTVPTNQILSPKRFTAFWIKISNSGLVEFGKEGEELALLSYKDPMPLDINYFSFASWSGVELKILYDCPSGSNDTEDSEEVEKNLPLKNQLQNALLKNYDSFLRPTLDDTMKTKIFVYFDVTGASYDVIKSVFSVHGTLFTNWIDPRLQWNLTQFNMSKVDLTHFDIWKPELVIHDAVNLNELTQSNFNNMNLLVEKTGRVFHYQKLNSLVWCKPGEQLKHWPRDQHTCSLKIGVWSQVGKIQFLEMPEINENESLKFLPHSEDSFTTSVWELVEIEKTLQWSDYTSMNQLDEDTDENNFMSTTITIRRRSQLYSMIYFTPFVASVVIVLTSLWLPPSQQFTKMALLSFNLIFMAVCLEEVLNKMPTAMTTFPNIVRFYAFSIFIIWISIIINTLQFRFFTPPRPWPYMHFRIKSLLTSPLAMSLWISPIENQDSYKEFTQETIPVCPKEKEDNEELYWELLATAVDRLLFSILVIVYITMFFAHY